MVQDHVFERMCWFKSSPEHYWWWIVNWLLLQLICLFLFQNPLTYGSQIISRINLWHSNTYSQPWEYFLVFICWDKSNLYYGFIKTDSPCIIRLWKILLSRKLFHCSGSEIWLDSSIMDSCDFSRKLEAFLSCPSKW